MAEYRVSVRHSYSELSGPTSSVRIEPELSEESRACFNGMEQEHLLDQYQQTGQGYDLYSLTPTIFANHQRDVKLPLDQKFDTIKAIIESAAIRTTRVLRGAGKVASLFINGELVEEIVPSDDSLPAET